MTVDIKDIEKMEIEYNVLLYRDAAARTVVQRNILNLQEKILKAKADYLDDCLQRGVEPDLDLIVVRGPNRPTMWGASSD